MDVRYEMRGIVEPCEVEINVNVYSSVDVSAVYVIMCARECDSLMIE